MLLSLRRQLGPVGMITYREVRDQFRDWRIIFPVLLLTLVFPFLMNFTAKQAVAWVGRYGADLVAERFIPFLLMVVGFFPISVSLVIALESFVGEKERHSIEPLLSSPLTDLQLYLGKLLAAMVPPLMGSFLGITVYLVGVYTQVGWTAPPVLLIQIVLLTISQAVLMVCGAVVVSAQTTSVRAANLLASFIIIPMAFLIQGESMVMFWAQYDVLWLAILGQLLIAGLLIRTGVAHFNREELLGRELDTLNLRWGWQVFKRGFVGSARSPKEWLRHEVPLTLRRLALPAVFMIAALALGLWAGVSQSSRFVLPADALHFENLKNGFVPGMDTLRFFSLGSVGSVWLHNLRTILLATLLGIFSFGVLGVLVLMIPLALIGFLMGSLAGAGLPPLVFFSAFILPHGIFEIPAIILSGAAILALGGTLAAPAQNQTIGEAWLRSLAQWARALVAVIIPLFLFAAVIEVLVTPQVAAWALSGW